MQLKVILVASFGLVVACATYTVRMEPPKPRFAPPVFKAGAARADITPPAGYPFFGYSLTGKHVARGFQSRLYARAFYLEGSNGESVALVQCDLGAISALLHRKVAALVAPKTGLGPDRILIAATHTHSAPGGYFEAAFYNHWGSKEPGFDPGLLDFLSERIAEAIHLAFSSRGPSVAAVGVCDVDSVSYNRSLRAHLANFDRPPAPGDYDAAAAVNRRFTMLRIDRVAFGDTIPLGVFTNFAIHGTVIGPENDLYSADCQGAAERYLEAAIRGHYEVSDSLEVIHALTNGMAGDVAPAFDRNARGFMEARRIGQRIAAKAFALFRSLNDSLSATFPIERAYREVSLRETLHSSRGAKLSTPRLGFPLTGGTEDGFSPFHFFWPGAEGSRAKSVDVSLGPVGLSLLAAPLAWNGYDSAKFFAAGGLHDRLLAAADFPQVITLQALRLGHLVVAAVPGEVTTSMGQDIERACSTATPAGSGRCQVIVVSLANQYLSYFTTADEYNAQHYEGASSLWGPHAGEFIRDELADLVNRLGNGEAYEASRTWTFLPGARAKFADFQGSPPGSPAVETVRIDTTGDGQRIARCYWWDENPLRLGFTQRYWQVEVMDTGGEWRVFDAPGIDAAGTLQTTDKGLDLEVRACSEREVRRALDGDSSLPRAPLWDVQLWCVSWAMPRPEAYAAGLPSSFRFALYRLGDASPLTVASFATD